MGSVTYNGPIPEDDPRYKEGITILIPLGIKEKSEKDSEKSDRSGSQRSTNKQSEKNKNEYQNDKS